MRFSTSGRSTLLLVALALSACDSRTITGSARPGRVQLTVPWLGGRGALARQTAASPYDVVTLHVTIGLASGDNLLLDRAFTAGDGVFTFLNPPVNDVQATGTVEFPVPAGAGHETFQFVLEAKNADGVVLYKIGPVSFELASGGQPTTISERPVYVGPNSGVTSVKIQLSSTSPLIAGQTLPISCVGNPGGVSNFAHSFTTDNEAIAVVDNLTTLRGVAPGTAHITCEMDWGSHATDVITVVVGAAVASVAVTPNPGSVSVGGTLQMVASTRDASNNVLTGRTVTWATSNAAVASVGPTSGVVTGVTAGSVTITATSEGRTGTATVSVSAAPTTGGISGVIQSATNGNPLANALVEVRAGSATTGPTAATSVTTGVAGTFSFSNLPAGAYTVLATATLFASVSRSVTVVAGQTAPVTIALPSTSQCSLAICIVLTWGAVPSDLDSHLYLPDGSHIYWANPGTCSVSPFACLVNDEQQPNSSEYTNITQMQSGSLPYTFRVFDYTNGIVSRSGTTDLSNSNAKVDVFVGGVQVRTFSVPGPNQTGWLWTVFTLSGSLTAPTITASNQPLEERMYPSIRAPAGQAGLMGFQGIIKKKNQ